MTSSADRKDLESEDSKFLEPKETIEDLKKDSRDENSVIYKLQKLGGPLKRTTTCDDFSILVGRQVTVVSPGTDPISEKSKERGSESVSFGSISQENSDDFWKINTLLFQMDWNKDLHKFKLHQVCSIGLD